MDDTMQNSGAVSPELDEMVGRLLDNMLGALAAGEDPGVAIVVEDASAHAYEALFCDDGAEQCLEAATAFVAEHTGGIQMCIRDRSWMRGCGSASPGVMRFSIHVMSSQLPSL